MNNSFNLSNMYSNNAQQAEGPYGDGNRYTEDVYDPSKNKITQSLDDFLSKYKDAIGPDGSFIPGKANLHFDGMNAANVYHSIIGEQNGIGHGAFAPARRGQSPVFNSEVNADWIEDTRPGGGWASVKDGVLPVAATIGTMYGGSMLLGEGLGAGLGAGTGVGGTGTGIGTMAADIGVTAPSALTPIASSGFSPMVAEGLGAMGAGAVGAGVPSAAASTLPELTGMPIASGGFVNAAPTAGSLGTVGTTAGGAGAAMDAATTAGATQGGGSGFLSNFSNLSNLAKAGSSLYSAYKGKEGADATQNALQDQMKTLTDMYKEGSPWANQLKEGLARKDAAAGRNSQYGARLAQYQAMLADKAGQNAGVLGQLATQSGAANTNSNNYLNLLLNRGGDVANALGITDTKVKDAAKNAWDYFFGG